MITSINFISSDTAPKVTSGIEIVKLRISTLILTQKYSLSQPYQCLLVLFEKNVDGSRRLPSQNPLEPFLFGRDHPYHWVLLSSYAWNAEAQRRGNDWSKGKEWFNIFWLSHPVCLTVVNTTEPHFWPGRVYTGVLKLHAASLVFAHSRTVSQLF